MFWRHFQKPLRKEKIFAKHRQTSSNPIHSFQLLLFVPPQTKLQQVILLVWVQLKFHDYLIPVRAVLKGGGVVPSPFFIYPKLLVSLQLRVICSILQGAAPGNRSSWKSAFPHPALHCALPLQLCWMSSNVSTCDQTNREKEVAFSLQPPYRTLAEATIQLWPKSNDSRPVSVSLKNCSKMSGV